MTIRPIIFSQDMVCALLEGRKTQTRRLATSPLRKCEPGDLLYVREHWRTGQAWDENAPREITPGSSVSYEADGLSASMSGRPRRGMHMPRWASRLTLRVTEVRFQPVKALTTEEAYAEGAIDDEWTQWREDVLCIAPPGSSIENERGRFKWLWDSLHPVDGERWEDNPEVVALTFEVIHGNVDQIARAA